MTNGIQRAIERYLSWSLPVRLAVGVFASAVGGFGLGLISEYAAYRYAIHIGIRPPFEGIPYLRVSIASLTFIALFGGGAGVWSDLRATQTLSRVVGRNRANFPAKRKQN